jgi:hypothetical protein
VQLHEDRVSMNVPGAASRRATIGLIVIVLAACAVPGGSAGDGSEAPTGSNVAAALGTFDRAALEKTFGTTLTEADLTETKRRYTADYRLPLGLEFTIDPADASQHLLETSIRFSVARTDAEMRVERAWFRLVSPHQPKAVQWIRDQRDRFLAGKRADISVRSFFGPLCAGFFAFGAATSPTGKAETMGYFAETQDAHVNCQGPES